MAMTIDSLKDYTIIIGLGYLRYHFYTFKKLITKYSRDHFIIFSFESISLVTELRLIILKAMLIDIDSIIHDYGKWLGMGK